MVHCPANSISGRRWQGMGERSDEAHASHPQSAVPLAAAILRLTCRLPASTLRLLTAQVRAHLEDRHTIVSIAAGVTLQSLKVGSCCWLLKAHSATYTPGAS